MAVCSWIAIPAGIPFTLQTFGVLITAGLLGARRGVAAVLIYLLLGAVGVPVFANFGAGPGVLLGPTGGYLVGFIFTALLTGWLIRFFPGKLAAIFLAMLVGLLVCYAFGTAWFMIVYARSSGAIGLAAALAWCVAPFIIPDLLKITLAALLVKRLSPYMKTAAAAKG
ncbi:MAG: biotin transporter BioY [Clostridia bacterium]|nr:biotin transporter BioY [Clostridia bacterium]